MSAIKHVRYREVPLYIQSENKSLIQKQTKAAKTQKRKVADEQKYIQLDEWTHGRPDEQGENKITSQMNINKINLSICRSKRNHDTEQQKLFAVKENMTESIVNALLSTICQ